MVKKIDRFQFIKHWIEYIIIKTYTSTMSSIVNRRNANAFLQTSKRKIDEVEDVKPSLESNPEKKKRVRVDKKCIGEGCTKFASFGPIGKKKIYCKTHYDAMILSLPTTQNSITPLPSFTRAGNLCKGGCGKQPTFGPRDTELMTYCKDCKPDGYVGNKLKLYPRCKAKGCRNTTTRVKIYCKDHMSYALDITFASLVPSSSPS
jgi:hypothetical protein